MSADDKIDVATYPLVCNLNEVALSVTVFPGGDPLVEVETDTYAESFDVVDPLVMSHPGAQFGFAQWKRGPSNLPLWWLAIHGRRSAIDALRDPVTYFDLTCTCQACRWSEYEHTVRLIGAIATPMPDADDYLDSEDDEYDHDDEGSW